MFSSGLAPYPGVQPFKYGPVLCIVEPDLIDYAPVGHERHALARQLRDEPRSTAAVPMVVGIEEVRSQPASGVEFLFPIPVSMWSSRCGELIEGSVVVSR